MHLDRLISVLETVAIAGRPVSPAELQRATALPRPTCYRLLRTLAEHRLLESAGHSPGYQIGRRLMRIAIMGQSDIDVCQAAASTLHDAAIELGEAVFLSRFRDNGVEIIHVETPTDPARSFIHPGLGYRPMHACSCAKAIAACADSEFQGRILSGPMRSYTRRTKSSREALAEEFAVIRKRGYAECVEEMEVGVSSVAAPICIGSAGATFSIGATGPIRRFNLRYRNLIGPKLIDIATKVSSAIQLRLSQSAS